MQEAHVQSSLRVLLASPEALDGAPVVPVSTGAGLS